MNKFRAYISTYTCFVLPRTHQCGSGINVCIYKHIIHVYQTYIHIYSNYQLSRGTDIQIQSSSYKITRDKFEIKLA